MKIKLSERLRMAVEKDIAQIDEDAKETRTKKPQPEHEHFVKCSDCAGSGLQGDALCARCSGSGKVLGS